MSILVGITNPVVEERMRAIARLVALASVGWAQAGLAADLDTYLAAIQAVGPEGRGNRAAASAWQELVKADATALPRVLAALDQSNPLAANWLHGAVDAIAERQLLRGKLPTAELEQFVRDTSHNPRARRLAFEWLARADATARARLIPTMANDPSVELRRDAVQQLIDKAYALHDAKDPRAGKMYQEALAAARDNDQVKTLVERLRKLGLAVDLPRHFGFLMDWKVIGPFDNTDGKGFNVAYPPEQQLDLKASYKGKTDTVRWTDHVTTDDYGMVDLTKALAPHKGAVSYALTEFTSERRQPVQLRLGCVTAYKIWLNGKLVFARDEYHRGMAVDQYQLDAVLEEGRNTILVKVCQNEQKEDWAQKWQFQLRVCDATGTAILSTTRPATKQDNTKSDKGAGATGGNT